ncbi:histidinol dehydrogenase, partial [Tepidimonas sp.]|uniref:histidinol dehydrogenase n=1 Tax=Tepidimonas sp. TaxID=2002775 RepID=UPI00391989D7
MPLRLSTRATDFEQRFASLLAMKREVSEEVNDVVRAIGQDVAARGDAAVIEYTAKFDKLALTP